MARGDEGLRVVGRLTTVARWRAAILVFIAAGAGLSGTGCDSDATPAGAPDETTFVVSIGVTNDAGTLASVAIDIALESDRARFGAEGDPVCEITAPASFGAVTPLRTDLLRASIGSFVGLDTPVNLVRCRGSSHDAGLGARDFTVVLVEALTPAGAPASPPPALAVTGLDVGSPTTTTTPENPATTTTLTP